MALTFDHRVERSKSGRTRFTRYTIIEGNNKKFKREINEPNSIAIGVLDSELKSLDISAENRSDIIGLLQNNPNLRYLNMNILAKAIYISMNSSNADDIKKAIIKESKTVPSGQRDKYILNMVRYIRFWNKIFNK